MTRNVNVNLLDFATLFLCIAKPADIEAERQRLEAEHGMKIEAFEITYPRHSGALCTRVSWLEKN